MAELLSSDYVERRAGELLPKAMFDFIAGGADEEATVEANLAALQAYRLRPRILRDVSSVDMSLEIYGRRIETPLFVAPMGGHQIAHADGELASARASAWAGVGFMMSTASSFTLEDAAKEAGPGKWFQLYCFKDRGVTEDLVRRAEAAQYEALVVTVDAPVLGLRRRDLRNEFIPGPHIRWANLEPYGKGSLPGVTDGNTVLIYFMEQIDATVTWDDVAWIKSLTSLPVLVKGVLSAEDARQIVASGLDGVYVSNHGGRQLDRTKATLEALPEVVDAIAGAVPIVVDGGIRSSGDVLVALGLGASAVAIGRPVLYALGIGGDEAAAAYLGGMARDLERSLALIGATSLGEVDRSMVVKVG